MDNQGKRVLILDRNFYAVIKEEENPQAVMEKILSRKAEFSFIVRLEHVKRSFSESR